MSRRDLPPNRLAAALLAGWLATAPLAWGSVTITSGAVGILRDEIGAMLPAGRVGLLVADVSGDGLTDPLGTTLVVESSLGGDSDDLILGVYQTLDLGESQFGLDLSATTFDYGGAFDAGVPLWLVWFPASDTPGASVSAGAAYGKFRTDSIDALGTMAWIAPGDGTNHSLFSLDAALGGEPAIPESAFTANFVVVPESGAFGPILSGLLLLLGVARRRLKPGENRSTLGAPASIR